MSWWVGSGGSGGGVIWWVRWWGQAVGQVVGYLLSVLSGPVDVVAPGDDDRELETDGDD